jgi:hypothetical protein
MEPIRWTADEYVARRRGTDWYWALGIIAAAAAVTAIIVGNFLFAVVIIIGSFVLVLYARKKPVAFEFEINEKGIVIGQRLYPFRTLESFWIPDDGAPRIIVHSKRLLVPQIVIPLSNEVSIEAVHAALQNALTEDEHTEPLSERLGEWLGF